MCILEYTIFWSTFPDVFFSKYILIVFYVLKILSSHLGWSINKFNFVQYRILKCYCDYFCYNTFKHHA